MIVRLNSTLCGASGVRELLVTVAGGASDHDALWTAQAGDSRIGSVLVDVSSQLRQDLLIMHNGRAIRLLYGLHTSVDAEDRLELFLLSGAQRALWSTG